MKRTLAASCIMAVALAPVSLAQSKDFSGRWTVDGEKTAAANPKPIGPTSDMTITMDAKTMTVLSTGRSGLTKTTYSLDGSETKNASAVGMNGSAPAGVASTAKWDGAVLVITIKLYGADATLRYSSDGTTLKSEFVNPQSGSNVPRTIIYKKVSQTAYHHDYRQNALSLHSPTSEVSGHHQHRARF
jgi:hypothetical protein